MKASKNFWTCLISLLSLFFLIIDAKTALTGAKEGITICLYTVIPSLFPFILFSLLINNVLIGKSPAIIKPLGKLCGIPSGCESLMLLGFLGGYPVGAQSVYQAYHTRQLHRQDAQRMLSFCNNAGPSFVLGMLSLLFRSPYICIILWCIHIFSAILVGIVMPGKSRDSCHMKSVPKMQISDALEQSIRVMANICGWIVLFRVLINILNRWILWIFPYPIQTIIMGTLEISNGCLALFHIEHDGLKFILSSIFLSLGGICVALQTMSVIKELSMKQYYIGKLLQCLFSIILSILLQFLLFPPSSFVPYSDAILIITCILILVMTSYLHKRKKVVAFSC